MGKHLIQCRTGSHSVMCRVLSHLSNQRPEDQHMRPTKLTIALVTAGAGVICLAPAASADVTTGPAAPAPSPVIHLSLLPPDPIRNLLPPEPIRLNLSPVIGVLPTTPNLNISPCIKVGVPGAPNLNISPCIKVGSVDAHPTVGTTGGTPTTNG
jgi:hypothetical protein